MSTPRLATFVLGGCTGCHLSLLDAHEDLLALLGTVDLVFSPLTEGDDVPECDIALVEGAVATDHDAQLAREIRAKAGTVIAMGSCATLGGVVGLRNLFPVGELLDDVYGTGERPGEADGSVPVLRSIRALGDVIQVDRIVPGCSPPTARILEAVQKALAGDWTEPAKRNLCAECTRTHEKMLHPSREFVSDAVYPIMELETIDREKCFLEQGVMCMGPMTREGCGARCTAANVPCRGCNGPSRSDFEQGGKAVDMLGAVLPAGAIMFLDDLIGTGYRYSTAVSVFPGTVTEGGEADA